MLFNFILRDLTFSVDMSDLILFVFFFIHLEKKMNNSPMKGVSSIPRVAINVPIYGLVGLNAPKILAAGYNISYINAAGPNKYKI